MSNLVKASFICGLVFVVIGSFLPWQREGDFISYLTYGIRIFPALEDNGGILTILLSFIVLMLIFRPLKFIERPLVYSIAGSLALALASVFHLARVYIRHINAIGVTGAPTIEIGLVLVFVGSVLLLLATLRHYHSSTHPKLRLSR